VIAVAEAVRERRLPAPVVDPVIASTSGARLLDEAGQTALCSSLLPFARIVTPNVPEAELLSGMRIESKDAMRAAARTIRKLGPRAVLIKGGHLGRGSERAAQVTDLLFDGHGFVEFSSWRISGDGAHGTGCALSAAIAAYLAQGLDLETAVRRARSFVTRALRRRFTLGAGRPLLDHFAALAKPKA
jgi:hydroxymethylpyrimidine/phosphomethylpyrimidine kinase